MLRNLRDPAIITQDVKHVLFALIME